MRISERVGSPPLTVYRPIDQDDAVAILESSRITRIDVYHMLSTNHVYVVISDGLSEDSYYTTFDTCWDFAVQHARQGRSDDWPKIKPKKNRPHESRLNWAVEGF